MSFDIKFTRLGLDVSKRSCQDLLDKLDIKRLSPSILYISGLIWIQTIGHSDGIAKGFFKLMKKSADAQETKIPLIRS